VQTKTETLLLTHSVQYVNLLVTKKLDRAQPCRHAAVWSADNDGDIAADSQCPVRQSAGHQEAGQSSARSTRC